MAGNDRRGLPLSGGAFVHHGYHAHDHIVKSTPLMDSPDLRSPMEGTFGGEAKTAGEPMNSAVAYPQSNGYATRSRSGTASAYGHPWYTPDVAQLRDHTSVFTRFLLGRVERWPLLHSILAEKDSRRIFYFMSLNFVFMLLQTFYGVATGSLGLLSDSIHMLFDCLALGVGLCAAVVSKWPPSARFPYGLGKMDTLAGFANGIFLMLISVEIVTEAIERLVNGAQMKRLGELLTVSLLGLGVNIIGMMAFDHAHHGHGHGHGHGHSHGHAHSHGGHKHDHSHDTHKHGHHHRGHDHQHHNHGHSSHHSSPLIASNSPNTTGQSHSHHQHHHHSHGSENMHGIFLHVLADTLGSVAVVISTLLIHFYSWPGFDPLASCIIAILIFASAIPLVISSAKTLLLTIPADTEYTLRETLIGVSSLRGVSSYRVPKFWLNDREDATASASASASCGNAKVLGVIHIIAARGTDMEEVRQRVVEYMKERNVDAVVQVEKEGESRCWCAAGVTATGFSKGL